MSCDEFCYVGFINDVLKDFGIGVNMGFLVKVKKYIYFKFKFIYYVIYLLEKIGYVCYIIIYWYLEKNFDQWFYLIFKWFK